MFVKVLLLCLCMVTISAQCLNDKELLYLFLQKNKNTLCRPHVREKTKRKILNVSTHYGRNFRAILIMDL